MARADDGTGERATKSDTSSAHEATASKAGARTASPAGRHQNRAATATAGPARSPSAAKPRPTPAVAASRRTAPTSAAAASVAPSRTVTPVSLKVPFAQSISTALDGLLYATANLLSTLPQGPITHILEGGLWVVRRTLFPASVGVITSPVVVPLYFTGIDSDGNGTKDDQKLGIYATLGNGATPQLFEFDTGASGFFAAYASNKPSLSNWWGNGVGESTTLVSRGDDSGISYSGVAANTTVSLFAQGSSLPYLSTGKVQVGQTNLITRDGTNLWTPSGTKPDGSIKPPPIEGAFYGDFGAGPNFEDDNINSLLSQLTFGRGVSPGFIVHADEQTGQAWVQIGLTSADLQNPATLFFAMDPDKAAGDKTVANSGVRYYNKKLFKSKIAVFDGVQPLILDSEVAVTPDTGAHTTVHNTDNSSSAQTYDEITDWSDNDHKKGKLKSGLLFFLTGTTSDGQSAQFFDFTTADTPSTDTATNEVDVRNDKSDKSDYFLNSGIELFYAYDVVYDLGNSSGGGRLGLTPQSS
jgi:hypothetical protein